MTEPVLVVLDDLAQLMERVVPDMFELPTPCAQYDVEALRRHVLGWLPMFAAALSDRDGSGPRPDVEGYAPPDDPRAAAGEVHRSAGTIRDALAGGAADRPVRLLGDHPLPGSVVLAMLTGELIAHGWDLASATGLPWNPPAEAVEAAGQGMSGMLVPEYRGEGKPFGVEVPVPDDASPLDRLIGFTGRDPNWKAPVR